MIEIFILPFGFFITFQINATIEQFATVSSGVSQRYLLVPLLINIFINDIFEIISYPYLFADNLKSYLKINLIDNCLMF